MAFSGFYILHKKDCFLEHILANFQGYIIESEKECHPHKKHYPRVYIVSTLGKHTFNILTKSPQYTSLKYKQFIVIFRTINNIITQKINFQILFL